MEKRYTALRIIGTLYKVLGIIVAVITVLAVLAICAAGALGGAAWGRILRNMGEFGPYMVPGAWGGALGGAVIAIVVILYGGLIAISLYAAGEGVYLLLALEENTRATAMLLQRTSGSAPTIERPE